MYCNYHLKKKEIRKGYVGKLGSKFGSQSNWDVFEKHSLRWQWELGSQSTFPPKVTIWKGTRSPHSLSLSPFFPQLYLRRINKFSRTRDRNEKMDSTSVPTTGFYTKLSNLAVLILVLLSCSTFTCTGQCLMFLFYFAYICSQKTDCSPLLPVVGFGGIMLRVSHFFWNLFTF